ncbi:DNA cross-link repair protein PSO2 LALA0_S02e04610g [Lachancea lanzarotensis]|uniref:LALA0S02e04610g1_1 n=1 Tax=Lachancea lanzarotensis TaxID=1245769 RepID=A0A0C7MZJ8_9SACH|nr:uncharacterized protein LALA0_S02e04610g [Lachancea lanzarotensis]CEP61005.1 LALA0S02e04610g1_1 [Lachancea lanzarotensis]
MPENKRQRTLVDFKIPKTHVLPGNQPKRHKAEPLYIDLECDEIETETVLEQNSSSCGPKLFVSEEEFEYTEKLEILANRHDFGGPAELRKEEKEDEEVTVSHTAEVAESDTPNTPKLHRSKISAATKQFPVKLQYKPEKKPRILSRPSKIDMEPAGSEMRVLPSVSEVGPEQQLLCPVCGIVLTLLKIHEREIHCDTCVTVKRPLTSKRTGRPAPKLSKVKKLFFKNHTIVVDGFNFDSDPAINQYFLSHFHADHYMGIKKSWAQGSIYCSKVTADLLSYKFKVPHERMVALPENVTVQVTENLSVICFDANHCPGSFVFLFRESDDQDKTIQWVLHTGDFRSNNDLISRINSHTNNARIDKVYLDTTYMYPSYHFPLQHLLLDATSDFTRKLKNEGFQKLFGDRQSSIMSFLSRSLRLSHLYKFVFLVGTYTIGKEKLAVAIAQKLGTKIFLPKDTSKHRIFQTYQHHFPEDIITHDITKSCVHLVSIRTLASKESLQSYYKPIAHIYENMVCFHPTGWSFKNGGRFIKLHESADQKKTHTLELLDNTEVDRLDVSTLYSQYDGRAKFQVFRVPYSEHSSFKDLANFCVKLPWAQMIPTVNTHDAYMVEQMQQWFSVWKSIQDGGKTLSGE